MKTWATVNITTTPTEAMKCTTTSAKKCPSRKRVMVSMLSTYSGSSDSIRISTKVFTT